MLGFLRKFRIVFIESGQVKKYTLYAIGEIALVVIGILIALQINTWNINRIENAREKLLLAEIHKEFLFNKKELETTLPAHMAVRERCIALTKLFPIDLDELNLDTLANLLYKLDTRGSFDVSQGSINTIINSSLFEIIRDNELRSLLLQWPDLMNDFTQAEERAKDFIHQILRPYMTKTMSINFRKGKWDERDDYSFLGSVEFENMIIQRIEYTNFLVRLAENEDSKLVRTINRIIELTVPE